MTKGETLPNIKYDLTEIIIRTYYFVAHHLMLMQGLYIYVYVNIST